MNLCKCGCGSEVKKDFVRGHSRRRLHLEKKVDSIPSPITEKEHIMAIDTEKAINLFRKEKIWVCDECKKEYKEVPGQCSCGATAKFFIEREIEPEAEAEKATYVVKENIIYDGKHIKAKTVVTLVVKDRVTKLLLKEGLIQKVEKK